jgi:hypothetical protein
MLEGWKLNTIVSLQTSQPWLMSESGTNAINFSGSGDTADRWDFFGNPADFRSGANSIPFCSGFGPGGTMPAGFGCTQTSGVSGNSTPLSASATTAAGTLCAADAADKTSNQGTVANPLLIGSLGAAGCFVSVNGASVLTPPTGLGGGYGSGRNIFRDSGFKNVDFSVFKTFTFKERYGAQFRVEFFNLLNHPNIANPYGSVNGWGVGNDPSAPQTFGCGCATADIAAGNPQVGSGGARAMQLGLKLQF